MRYKTCSDCGSNNDLGELCDCKRQTSAARQIRAIAHKDTYGNEYIKTYAKMRLDNNLPSCVANDIADTAATKKADCVADATVRGYYAAKRRV